MARKTDTGPAKTKTEVLTKKAQFEFPASEAQEVYLAGDFNNWDASANPITSSSVSRRGSLSRL
jgi:1,4-alpha-glucan branching enzyme